MGLYFAVRVKFIAASAVFSIATLIFSHAKSNPSIIDEFVGNAEQITLKLSHGNMLDGVFELEIAPIDGEKSITINMNALYLFSASISFDRKDGSTVGTFKNILRDKYTPNYKTFKINSEAIKANMAYITRSICDYISSGEANINPKELEYDNVTINLRFRNLLPDTQDISWKTNAISFTREEFLNWLEIAKSIPRESAIEEIIPGEPWLEGKEFPAPPESGKPVSR